MEADRLLFEDALASTSVKVKEEDVGMSVDGLNHNAQELNGEAMKGISIPHDSLTNNEAVELQRGRTPLPHSQSETRIKVVEPGRGQKLCFIIVMQFLYVLNYLQ
jgi:hypothetical protein